MDLHRIEGRSEWASVAPPARNIWQKVASRTGGIVTIGNFFSLLGLLSVPIGLYLVIGREAHFVGIAALALGRLCDLLDGMLADATSTKSPLGEKIDASFDKISAVAVLAGLAFAGIMPWWAVGLLLVPHILVAAMALSLHRRGKVMHPSRAGKLSVVPAWFSILIFIAADADWADGKGFGYLAYGLVVITAMMSLVAIAGYKNEYVSLKNEA